MSRTQLLDLGYTRNQIQRRADAGRLHRIHRGVYAVGHTNLALHGRWLAAVLACGPGALLSHRDAAALHHLLGVGSGLIDVTSPGRHHIPGIRCHCSRLAEGTTIDAIAVTTLEQTLLDLAEVLNARRLRAALEQAQRMDKLDFRRLDALIARSRGHRGLRQLRPALAELDDEPQWTQSELERRFTALARAHGLPRPQTNVYVEGELVDACWPQQRLVVEVDGWTTHKTRRSFEDDRRRDVKLVAAGWRVVRFTYRRITDYPGEVAENVRRLLRAAPWPPPVRSGR